jgi:hypothetical protein
MHWRSAAPGPPNFLRGSVSSSLSAAGFRTGADFVPGALLGLHQKESGKKSIFRCQFVSDFITPHASSVHPFCSAADILAVFEFAFLQIAFISRNS